MDTSKEYILMCQEAEEIQKDWVPRIGDYCYFENGAVDICIDIIDLENGCFFGVGIREAKSMVCRLPRQAQLQKISEIDNTWRWFALCYYFLEHQRKPCSVGDSHFNDISPEKVAIQVVMREKYNKIWTGKEWEIEK